ncbi:MAG: hypothetical protein RLZ35_270 [Pseudomonadota bacterium]|jgi:GTP pyrophosphokinase
MVQISNRYPEHKAWCDEQTWLALLGEGRATPAQEEIQAAIAFVKTRLPEAIASLLPQESLLYQGLSMAAILNELHLDGATLVAAILYPLSQQDPGLVDAAKPIFRPDILSLLMGTRRLGSIHARRSVAADLNHLRFLLMAVVEDLRVILLKLAEQTVAMRLAVRSDDKALRQRMADEALHVYAPLANRLGIGQIKWELEDLAFRCLEPDTYKHIAQLLDEKRVNREDYINQAVAQLEASLRTEGIVARVTGRAKHIFSIWKKMQNKHLDYHEIYDIRAVRIIVKDIRACYTVLGIVHTLWQHVPKEFDDYIANPKENGYQSLHTAVLGPQGKTMEVQIRTEGMHEQAELGVAAHWMYKEGEQQQPIVMNKLSALRQILTWQAEMSLDTEAAEIIRSELFEDRVYVFTPAGEVLKLSKGATPLDFAYSVHTDLGHRCRGAKVDGRMVPLTSTLSNGQQVEILAAKTGGPSRDWLNGHLGYLKTAQARAKVHQWFKKQDRAKNATEGRNILEKELKRLAVHCSVEELAHQLKFAKAEELYVALGGGDIKLPQVIYAIQQIEPLKLRTPLPPKLVTARRHTLAQLVKRDPISVAGIGNLLCQTAKCCKPIPGDEIIGYILAGRGVSVHRKDCANILDAGQKNRSRLIEVRWEGEAQPGYVVDIVIRAYDRQGLIRDIGALLAAEKINVITLKTHVNQAEHTVSCALTIEVPSLPVLERFFGLIHHLPNIIDCHRVRG